MIELDGVSLRLQGRSVLDGISLSVGPEVVALVGPSGSGKTMLLRLLLGLVAPSAGRVLIAGQVASENDRVLLLPEARNVAMVFQDLALWPHLSVGGNLEFGLRARGVDKPTRQRRIAEALAWVGLEGKQNQSPLEVSGGERQRVAIARALVLEPVALLLDEPLGSLDVVLKHELCGLFGKLFSARGLPVLYVTHDPREALRLAERVIVLEAGRITQQGTFAELERSPATPFVQAFVRASRGLDA